jgi:hypothetical protein
VGERSEPEVRDVLFALRLDESPLEGCGGAPALTRAVEGRLRRSVFVENGDAADITISITSASANGASWRALIIEADRAGAELGRRDVPLPAADCPKALDTLAVVLAIMLGSTRTTTEPPHRPSAAVPPPPPPPPPPSAAKGQVVPPPPRPPPPLRWMASPLVGIAAGTGILPRLAWAIEAGVVVHPPVRRLSLLGRAAYWPPQTTGTRPPADASRVGGAVLGCFELFRNGALGLDTCGGADVSRLGTRSVDLTRASESSLLVAVLGEARLGYRLTVHGNVALEPVIAAQISALLRRDRFTYRDGTGRELTLLEPAPAAFQASFGVAVHFL